MPLRQAVATIRSAKAAAVLASIDGGTGAGYFEVYTGAQPATPETTASGTLLATVVLADPCGTETGGVLTFSDPDSVNAVATGTAGYCRVYDGDDAVQFDGQAATSGGIFNFSTLSLVSGEPVDCTGGTWTEPM